MKYAGKPVADLVLHGLRGAAVQLKQHKINTVMFHFYIKFDDTVLLHQSWLVTPACSVLPMLIYVSWRCLHVLTFTR